MTENILGGGGGQIAATGQGGQSPRQAETSQGIILMSAQSAISKCRTEIRLGTGRKSASREAGSVVLRVVTPEGLGSFYFRWKSLPRAGLQACPVSTQEAVAGGSGIFKAIFRYTASLRPAFPVTMETLQGRMRSVKWRTQTKQEALCTISPPPSACFRSKEKVRR